MLSLIVTSIAVAQDPTPMPKEYRDQLSRYVGEWETETILGGTSYKGTFTGKMAPGGECLIYHGKSPGLISTDVVIQGTGIIGWDPVKEQLKEVNFNTLGETCTTMWTLENGTLKGIREGVILGQSTNSKVENHWVKDGEEWEHRISNWILAGKEQDNVVTTFRRKARN
jgi:hypothetical protein